MDKIDKQIAKLTADEQQQVKDVFAELASGNTKHLDIKKLKGEDDIYRVRKGSIRILFRREDSDIYVLAVERRSDDTYKNI